MSFAARFFLRCVGFLLIFALLLPVFSSSASAQTPSPSPLPASEAQKFATPDVESNVPKNQHTLIQSVLIEMLLAVGCQLTGIDLASPQTPCLGINPLNNKLSYGSPSIENGEFKVGGLMGALGDGIAFMYTPTITTSDYTGYLAENFGLNKKALAAPPNGFVGLEPIRGMWIATRDVSYFLLILAFVFIGIGVMLRIKIDPRTVMTVQNQIPRVIIAIILITFSYAIAAIMIDLMWTSTYVLINLITKSTNPPVSVKECNDVTVPLSQTATQNILSSPFSYANRVFIVDDCDLVENGLLDLSKGVANAITELERDTLMSFLGLNPTGSCEVGGSSFWDYVPIIGFNPITALGDIGDCLLKGPIGNIFAWITSIIWMLIIFIIIIITFFRIWLELLKAYAMVILYTILAPLFIVINLLPKRPLGFERWIRVFFANLAIFPITVAMIILSKTFIHAFTTNRDDAFVPPLVGNPNMNNFGVIIGFAVLLLIPQMISLLREKLGVPPVKQTAAIGAAFSSGASAAGAVPSKTWKHLNRRNPQTGAAMGYLAVQRGKLASGAMRKFGTPGKRAAAQKEFMEATGRRGSSQDIQKIASGQGIPEYGIAGWNKGADIRTRKEKAEDARQGIASPVQRAEEQQSMNTAQRQAQETQRKEDLARSRGEAFDVNLTINTPTGSHIVTGKSNQPIRQVISERLAANNAPPEAQAKIMGDITSKGWDNMTMEEARSDRDVAGYLRDPEVSKHLAPPQQPPTGGNPTATT